MQLFSCELTGFITCSIINRRTLPIKGTVQELAIYHPLSTQKLQVLLCLSLWHQAAVRLDGLDLLGKKTLMSMFKMVVESVRSRQLSPTTRATLWQPVYSMWGSQITLSHGLSPPNRGRYTDWQTSLRMAAHVVHLSACDSSLS